MAEVDVGYLLAQWTPEPVMIETGHSTYTVKAVPTDNWTWHAFQAFGRLADQKLGAEVRSFAAIGTGTGLDAIGAAAVLKGIDRLYVTDVEELSLNVAVGNVKRNVNTAVDVTGLVGDVCFPLSSRGIKVDVIYGNLPALPAIDSTHADSGTFYAARHEDQWADDTPARLLSLQYRFLTSARHALTEGGCAILVLGDRYPSDTIPRLGAATKFRFEDLWIGFKQQSEAEVTTHGFAQFESDVAFDFYEFEPACEAVGSRTFTSAMEMKEELREWRLTAAGAADLVRLGRKVGHVVRVIKAVPVEN